MPINQIKVRIPDLLEGMYVARLDRPWLDTPYKIQGFHIKTQQDIDKLQQYAEFVYIDVEKSKLDNGADSRQNGDLSDTEIKQKLTGIKPRIYQDISEFKSEMNTALENHKALAECVDDVMKDISNNENLKMPMLRKAVTPMVESIVRNPDAFSWLTMMKTPLGQLIDLGGCIRPQPGFTEERFAVARGRRAFVRCRQGEAAGKAVAESEPIQSDRVQAGAKACRLQRRNRQLDRRYKRRCDRDGSDPSRTS
jgi:hypothetical protein